MKRIKQAIIAAVLLASTAMTAQAAVSLKSSGDQWGPAVADLLNSNENGNWNESRFLSTFANRFNGTEAEAKALLASLKAGNVPTSADNFNATLPSTGGSGGSGGSTGGDSGGDKNYVTHPELEADQKKQDDAQKVVDGKQDDHINAVQGAAQTANDRASNLEVRADGLSDSIKETNAQLEVTDGRSINNATRLDGVEQKNVEQDVAIASKVDKTVFKADQDRQDAALSQETDNRTNADNALSDRINDKVSIGDAIADQKRQDEALAQESSDRQIADSALSDRIDTKVDQTAYNGDKATQSAKDKSQDGKITTAQGTANIALTAAGVAVVKADKAQVSADKAQTKANQAYGKAENAEGFAIMANGKVDQEVIDRKAADAVLDKKIDKNKTEQAVRDAGQDEVIATKVDKSVFKEDQDRQDKALSSEKSSRIAGDEYVNSRVDVANANIQANRQALVNTNKAVAQNTADIANHEQRIQGLERQTNARFSNMDKRIDDNKQKADAAIAGVAAMASIPQVTEGGRFSLGAGVGNRGSQQAVAVGMSSRLSDSVIGKASVANDTESQWTVGVGIAVQW
ncbi:hypothetical protein Hena1_01090 [Erwinia phage Hena1]|uniref:Trimeric autotransporter adhesin YadA-like C-terminal membrane anchor domain-containing protein n=1 Tax=Erwinia phage Hena1 TaxID=2678601 RepID=A0A6B9J9U3_9CAUD|nr:adhesin [Erwinia phage Hena1]QGZ16279.1 hypothetical protein Hena1_01090 [Erwinia phage Hena1]